MDPPLMFYYIIFASANVRIIIVNLRHLINKILINSKLTKSVLEKQLTQQPGHPHRGFHTHQRLYYVKTKKSSDKLLPPVRIYPRPLTNL